MAFEIVGKLIMKGDTLQKSEKFRIRDFVIEVSEAVRERTFTNFVKFQLTQDRTELIDRLNLGDLVKVHFNLRGSRWEKNGQTNYITNLDAWKIETVGEGGTIPPPPEDYAPDSFKDDLPF